MSSPHLNVSGLDFTPPAPIVAVATASTILAGSTTTATASFLSRIPVWVWLIVAAVIAFGVYHIWNRKEDKADKALYIAEENKRRLDDNDDPYSGLQTKF